MISKTVYECWRIAFDLAEDYQVQMSELSNSREYSEIQFQILQAKRDAASLIARKIKFGEVEHENYK